MKDTIGRITQLSNAPREPSPMTSGLATFTGSVALAMERDALKAENERLRAALHDARKFIDYELPATGKDAVSKIDAALTCGSNRG